MEFQGSGNFTNTITDNGGQIGIAQNTATGPLAVTITKAITTTSTLETIGTGALTFSANLSAPTFQNAEGTGGTVTLNGTDTFTAVNLTGGMVFVNSTAALGPR